MSKKSKKRDAKTDSAGPTPSAEPSKKEATSPTKEDLAAKLFRGPWPVKEIGGLNRSCLTVEDGVRILGWELTQDARERVQDALELLVTWGHATHSKGAPYWFRVGLQRQTDLDPSKEGPRSEIDWDHCEKQRKKRGERGPATDVRDDESIGADWANERFRTHQELATELRRPVKDVKAALERLRKRKSRKR